MMLFNPTCSHDSAVAYGCLRVSFVPVLCALGHAVLQMRSLQGNEPRPQPVEVWISGSCLFSLAACTIAERCTLQSRCSFYNTSKVI